MTENEDQLIGGSASTELAASRTAMAFERTALAAHRTLQAMLRTALSLIGFGFTIFNFFSSLSNDLMDGRLPREAAANFGTAMVVLGVLILSLGILDHYKQMQSLRARKKRLVELGLSHTELPFNVASSMLVAGLLLIIGLAAIANIAFRLITG